MQSKFNSFNTTIVFGESLDNVEVIGSYWRGHSGYYSTHNNPMGEPPEPSEIEIDEIIFEGVNIISFINHKDLENIEEEILEKLNDE